MGHLSYLNSHCVDECTLSHWLGLGLDFRVAVIVQKPGLKKEEEGKWTITENREITKC